MRALEYVGQVSEGKLPDSVAKQIGKAIKEFNGKRVLVALDEWHPGGSSNQQRYYFKCIVTPIWREWRNQGNAYSVEGVHHWLMAEFGWTEVVQGRHVLRSYMKLSKQEREQHHELCRAWAMENHGLALNLPNEPIEPEEQFNESLEILAKLANAAQTVNE